MAYTTIDDPSAFFQCTLYTGNGSNRSITNTGNSDLQPDFTWLKARSESEYNMFYDVVRGATKGLSSDLSAAEATYSDGLTAFGSDGFSLGTSNGINRNNTTYVSWNWKAGTSFTNDASSTSIGSIDSAGSASDVSGFSIVTTTGTGSAGTIKHGLSTAPAMIIGKRRDADNSNWRVYHKDLSSNSHILYLDTTSAEEGSNSATWNNTTPTTSVFSVGNSGDVNASGATIVFYCFAEKQGYSKFGTYLANGNADGPFVYTGFKPAWVLCKKSSATGDWELYDNKRNGFNGGNVKVIPNANDAETGVGRLSLLSNGFKITTSSGNLNTNAATYIYMAFAESPFVTSTGIPTPAR